MGLAEDLDYRVKAPKALQRVVQRIGSTRPGAWLFSKALHPLDRALDRLSRGRLSAPGPLAGLPVVMLTTTGAKSGLERTTPLIGIPHGEGLAVIGSNFGTRPTPGWVYNLEAHPNATLTYQDRTVAVRARCADPDEAAEVFVTAAGLYGGYARYRSWANHREIRVFVLERPS